MQELKNCPFCGSKAKISLKGNNFTKERSAIAKCNNCRANIVIGAIKNDCDWVLNKTEEAWNLRVRKTK